MVIETWRDIPGYEARYQASDLGNIRSLEREIKQFHGEKKYTRILKNRILRPSADKKEGHMKLVLCNNTKRKTYTVHVLVMLAFKGPRPENKLIRHLDGKPENNRLDNLCYGSRHDNVLDVYRIGQAWGILHIDDVFEIRKLLQNGMKNKDIAKLYGVSPVCISNIKRRRRFSWAQEGAKI